MDPVETYFDNAEVAPSDAPNVDAVVGAVVDAVVNAGADDGQVKIKYLTDNAPNTLNPDVIEILRFRQSPLFRLRELNHLIKELSEVRRYLIGKIIYHLAIIASKLHVIRMTSKSLAIIFGSVLIRAPLKTPLELVAAQNPSCVKDRVVHVVVFDPLKGHE